MFRAPRGQPYPIAEEVSGQISSAVDGARRRTGIKDVSPYTARHTASTELVINHVHPHIKDQIMGHVADDMSRLYTHVPQQPLIEAINKLPIIPMWGDALWMADPIGQACKLLPWTAEQRAAHSRLKRKIAA